MTIEQFQETGFSANTKVIYKGIIYDVIMVDFEECLIAIDEFPDDEDENKQLSWKRCENCDMVGDTFPNLDADPQDVNTDMCKKMNECYGDLL